MEHSGITIRGSVHNETQEQHDARMAWLREAKFGMFIHWGVYAVLAGVYKDTRDAEWIMMAGRIPVDEYREYANKFTAEDFQPDAWVDVAVKAGMKYIVITAKHHDGFALFPSDVTDWDVDGATPHGRDLIGELAKATRAKGLKFGLYYSHAQDWVHPGGGKGLHYKFEENPGWDEVHKGSYDNYLKTIAVPQVREILTRYQPDVLWYDTPVNITPERAKPFAELVSLRPGLIVNDRLGGGYLGDVETPENCIPQKAFADGRDWETCMTMNDNWGFVRDDNNWISFDQLLFNLVDIVSKGGNYLLNVGPDAKGRMPQPSIDLLGKIGEWLRVHGETIYNAKASPFLCRIPWGRCTRKPNGSNTTLYLHILNPPMSGHILLPGLQNEIISCKHFTSGEPATFECGRHGPVITLPADHAGILTLNIEGQPVVTEIPLLPDDDGIFRLTPTDAILSGELKPGQMFGFERIGGWESIADQSLWHLESQEAGPYRLILKATTPEGSGHLKITGPGLDQTIDIAPTKRWRRDYLKYDLGILELEKHQVFNIAVSTEVANQKPVYINTLELSPLA